MAVVPNTFTYEADVESPFVIMTRYILSKCIKFTLHFVSEFKDRDSYGNTYPLSENIPIRELMGAPAAEGIYAKAMTPLDVLSNDRQLPHKDTVT